MMDVLLPPPVLTQSDVAWEAAVDKTLSLPSRGRRSLEGTDRTEKQVCGKRSVRWKLQKWDRARGRAPAPALRLAAGKPAGSRIRERLSLAAI